MTKFRSFLLSQFGSVRWRDTPITYRISPKFARISPSLIQNKLEWILIQTFCLELKHLKQPYSEQKPQFLYLTRRHPNDQGLHVPVEPDLAQTVKVGSDHSENLTSVFNGAKNGNKPWEAENTTMRQLWRKGRLRANLIITSWFDFDTPNFQAE